MKKSYKFTSIILALLMALSITGCGKKELSDNIKIGTLVGPTGMGLIDLKDNENVDMELYQNPTDAVQKLIAGDIDVACVPSNLGGVLYNKTKGNIQILTTVVNGVLYVVENGETIKSMQDLKGKTIYGSGKGGTPEYVLSALLDNAGLKEGSDVQVEWLDSHVTVAQKVASNPGSIGLLPEPQVSSLTMKNNNVKIALDLNMLWKDMTEQELPMGIVIAKKDFVESRTEDVDILLSFIKDSVADVQTSSDEVVQKIVDAGIVPLADVCREVIDNCALVCYSGDETKAALGEFYKILFAADPTSIGGKMPGDDIYYGIG